MAKATVIRTLYVCMADGCDFSSRDVRLNDKGDVVSPPYGVVSLKPGEKGKCPVCGADLTTEEDGRHRFLRVNSKRIAVIRKQMRLVRNTAKGQQYQPEPDDIQKVLEVLFSETDATAKAFAPKAENAVKQHVPFAL